MSPSNQFAKSVAANLEYWRQRANDLSGPAPWPLAAERANLYRAIEYGLTLAQTWRQSAELILQYAPLMENDGNWREWLPLLERLTVGGPPSGVEDVKAVCTQALNIQGYYYLLDRRFDEALAVHRRQIRKGEALDLPLEVARGHYGLSHVYWRQREYDLAREHGQIALTGFRAAGAEPASQAVALSMLGLIDQYAGHYESSAGYLRQSVGLLRRVNEPIRLARTLKNLALTLEELGEIEAALDAYEEAADLLEVHLNELEKTLLELSRGTLYFNLGRLDEAEAAFLRANSPYLRQSSQRYYQAMVANNLGNVYLQRGDLDQAESCFEEAIDKWHQTKARVQLGMSLQGLAELKQARAELRAARTLAEQALAIFDHFPQDAFAQRLRAEVVEQLEVLNTDRCKEPAQGAVRLAEP